MFAFLIYISDHEYKHFVLHWTCEICVQRFWRNEPEKLGKKGAQTAYHQRYQSNVPTVRKIFVYIWQYADFRPWKILVHATEVSTRRYTSERWCHCSKGTRDLSNSRESGATFWMSGICKSCDFDKRYWWMRLDSQRKLWNQRWFRAVKRLYMHYHVIWLAGGIWNVRL